MVQYSASPVAKPWRQRFKAWNEIITSEKQYLDKLNFVIQYFKQPLEESVKNGEKVISQEEFNDVFGNIEQIRNFSKSLYEDWEKEASGTAAGNNVGKIFMTYVSIEDPAMRSTFLKRLKQFLRNFPGTSVDYLHSLCNTLREVSGKLS